MRDIERRIFDQEHEIFRQAFKAWVGSEIVPFHEKWEHDQIVPRELWTAAGEQGFVGMAVPERYGGGGSDDYRFPAIINEEIAYAGVFGSGNGFTVHNDIVLPYLLTLADDEQRQRWLPGMATGELIGAIAMTEPDAGSDLGGIKTRAVRHGDTFLVNGSKTFISNGIHSDVVIVVARSDRESRHGLSLLVLERGMPGFERGRNLDKMGLHAQDTAELFFNNVEVPATNLLGQENEGFSYLMQNLAQERLSLAVGAMAACEAALDWTIDYTIDRTAFGKRIADFQNTKFMLADMSTKVQVARCYLDQCIELHTDGKLSAEQAAASKLWCTELQIDVVNDCVQLHGGYGYMREYAIARLWADSRIQTIHGGTSQIMKEIIGRSIVRDRSPHR